MQTITFVKPRYFGVWDISVFREFAHRPRALSFIREVGSDLAHTAFERSGRSWDRFERFLEGLDVKHNRTANAVAYQHFLERLGKGEDAAFEEVESLAKAQTKAKDEPLTFIADIDRAVQEGKVDEQVLKKLSIESWREGGGNTPVKVVTGERGASSRVRGYITKRKYIEGKTPVEMGRILGLTGEDIASLKRSGAVVMELEQLPATDQFALRGYTQRPGGTAYVPGGKYPPGSAAPQWQLIDEMPVRVIGEVKPGEVFRSAPSPGR